MQVSGSNQVVLCKHLLEHAQWMNIPTFLFMKLFFSCAADVSTFEVIGEREKKTERQMVGQTDSQMDR